MKPILLIVPVLVASTLIAMAIFSRPGPEKQLQQGWQTLLAAQTATEELQAIRALTEVASTYDCYWEVNALRADRPTNLATQPDALAEADSISLTFYHGEKTYSYTGWVPVEKEHAFAFFQEG